MFSPRATRLAAIAAVAALAVACGGDDGTTSAPTTAADADGGSSSSTAPPDSSVSSSTTPSSDTTAPGDPTSTTASGQGAVVPTGTPSDVVTGLDAPWSVAVAGDAVLISERDSADVLELLDDGTTRPVGTVDGVSARGEGGLLGLAVGDDGGLFVYSTAGDGNRIERYELTGEAGGLGLGESTTIIDGLPANVFHNGGRIALGPDGMLYASVGDAGTADAAQDLDSLAGKILRMTPDGEVPDDNPFAGSFVYSYGHRNVQGLDWGSDGTMYASEFGDNTWDELNVIEAGRNYGWPIVEGIGEESDELVNPVQQWTTSEASPSGLAVVGETIFIANLRGEVLRSIPTADPSSAEEHFAGEYGRLRTVLGGPDGTLWFVTNNTDGRGQPSEGDDRILSVELAAP
ncbi:MAG: PQQ-dependent sugar dehydrogenase [Actinomycetota bacterium]|nr:PQQ-dependent sugar dehydrogenase [Actinomycetota bacterium]